MAPRTREPDSEVSNDEQRASTCSDSRETPQDPALEGDATSGASDNEDSAAENVDDKRNERSEQDGSADEGDDEGEQDGGESEAESSQESDVELVGSKKAYQDDGEVKMLGYRLKGENSIRHPKGFPRYARRYRCPSKRVFCEVSSGSEGIAEITKEQFNKRLKTSKGLQGRNDRHRAGLNASLTGTTNQQLARPLPSPGVLSNAPALVPAPGYGLGMYLEGYGSDAEFLTG
ncbi:hypothetical protein VNI00_018287 [Paramarasmius palmivorus]|uniref:Uncharacterized protein n=1 Tax=Paramarasmius palmivorus TaxID=297713 RepID=A0AAW0AZI6_9AGAR